MIIPTEPIPETPQSPRRRRRRGWSIRLTPGGLALLMALNLIVLSLLAWPLVKIHLPFSPRASELPEVTPSDFKTLITPSSTPTATTLLISFTPIPPSPSITPSSTPDLSTPVPLKSVSIKDGIILLSLKEGNNFHLFAYQPDALSLTRLTSGPWDDITPALSPDGTRVTFASNRNGYWDLYLLELTSGMVVRLTDTLEYDGAPSWSPDGLWLVYETYLDNNLELMIRSVANDQPPVRLTNNPAADQSPSWSPKGRKIAFVSNRNGQNQVWIADLDKASEDRYQTISQNHKDKEAHPVWSPDGNKLAWSTVEDGFHNLYVWDSTHPGERPQKIGSGDWPVWSQDGIRLLTVLLAPNQTYLTAYREDTPGLVLPPIAIPGPINGLIWGDMALPWPLPYPYKDAANLTPTPLWLPAITPVPDVPGGRQEVVHLNDVEAPFPMLHDMVDESFAALRTQLATDAGWDYLSTLENAFVPLTTPLDPGMGEDWLYTGRAFAVNKLPLNAGWMVAVREDFGSDTYWRIYLRVRYQDGSAGMPLHDEPWDFNARYSGDTTAYENGGALAQAIPGGYWLDFTQQVASYDWQRQPALSTWRASYPAARFNEYALTDGLDWISAMLELYPPEVLVTPSPIIPPTRTLTPTSRWYQSPTPTVTPTPRPTLTPIIPTLTASPTDTNTPTSTLSASPNPSPTPRPSQSSTPTRPTPSTIVPPTPSVTPTPGP